MKRSTLNLVTAIASVAIPAAMNLYSQRKSSMLFSSKELDQITLKVMRRGRLRIRRRLYKYSTPLWGQFKLRLDDEPFVLPVEVIFNEVGHPLKEGETLVVRASTIKEAFTLTQQMMYDKGYRPSPSNEGFWL
mgnify:CR=1 FL=1